MCYGYHFSLKKSVVFKASKIQQVRVDDLSNYLNIHLVYNVCTKLASLFAPLE